MHEQYFLSENSHIGQMPTSAGYSPLVHFVGGGAGNGEFKRAVPSPFCTPMIYTVILKRGMVGKAN